MSQKIKTSVEIDGSLKASQIANATTDTDKFLVSDGGTVKYRTGAEMLSDLGVSTGTASRIQHQVKAEVAINKGQAVYVTSANGTNMVVGLASNTSEATSSKTMGLLNATVAANGFADVITEGLLDGLNTSAATVGDPIWLGTGGNLIYGLANKPYAPNHLVFIGIVTRVSANNGEIFVKVQNGFELNEIHDVDLKSTLPSGNDILAYEGAPVNLWKNKTIPAVLGYTPYNASNPAGYISSYTETDTLQAVTNRGSVTTNPITINSTSLQHLTLNNRFNFIGSENFHISNNAYYSSGFKYKFAGNASKIALNSDNSFVFQTAATGTPDAVITFENKFWADSIGNALSTGSMRSPIFYDYNDTSYYIDPAGNSNLYYASFSNDVQMNGNYLRFNQNGVRSWNIQAASGNLNFNSGDGGGTYVFNGSTSFSSNSSWFGGYGSGSGPGLAFENQGTFARIVFFGLDFYEWDYGLVGGINNGYIYSNTSLRAPIFYDSNNTAYYGDFASTSNFNKLLLNSENSFNTTTPGLTSYGLTLIGGTSDYANGITWTWGNTNAQAGVYVQSSGAYGTKMYLATTDSFATGAKTAMTIDHSGNVSLNRGTFSNGSVWINNGASVNSYNENIRLYNASNGVSVIAFGASGTSGTPQSAILGFSDRYEVRVGSGDQWQQRSYSSYTEIYGSSRAPIFYDSNNTGYYVDPASTSNLSVMQAYSYQGNGNVGGTGNAAWLPYGFYAGNGQQCWLYGSLERAGYGTTGGGAAQYSIVYDTNNTGYYVDPASTSNINAITIGSASTVYNGLSIVRSGGGSDPYGVLAVSAPSGDNYAYMGFTRNGIVGMAMGIDTSNNYWIGTSGGGFNSVRTGTYMTVSGGGNVTAIGDFRAPIFYDSNDTTYYVDPASTSNIRNITVNSTSATIGLTVNHSNSNGVAGSKFVGATGNSYGAITAQIDISNYGTGIKMTNQNSTYANSAMQFFWNTTQVGGISMSTTSTSYATSSDYRLKENVAPMTSSVERLKELSPCRFNFISDPSKVVDGFIAHEVQKIIPEAVTGKKDELDYDGSPKYQGIDQSKIVPLLTSALQEAISKIEELENRLSILENK